MPYDNARRCTVNVANRAVVPVFPKRSAWITPRLAALDLDRVTASFTAANPPKRLRSIDEIQGSRHFSSHHRNWRRICSQSATFPEGPG
ncbi:hypothetical protein BQ8482_360104 [Mesorhizobium delmotii]|uniref:Uncharacterized protein n=1 Tax=Mesorhizobium delmotii TaxID=1631247 RepID=A0A2P9ARF8_9HYPH|nr:hypothetical protein BQ8482_360104 [Mesorhizobium delmotii]